MALAKRLVNTATCDSCGASKSSTSDTTKPPGTYGTVHAVTGDGITQAVDWFACKMPHVGKAVKAALSRAGIVTDDQADGDQADDSKPDGK